MDQVIKLHQGNWTLQFAVNTNDWCECTLIGELHTYRLGAEKLSYLAKKLFAAICGRNEKVLPDRKSYSWVFSLSEIHSSLYVAQEGDTKYLLWQDANARSLVEIYLSSEDCSRWCNQLKQII